jgi:hypothetical protein
LEATGSAQGERVHAGPSIRLTGRNRIWRSLFLTAIIFYQKNVIVKALYSSMLFMKSLILQIFFQIGLGTLGIHEVVNM